MHVSLIETLADFFGQISEEVGNRPCNPEYCPDSLRMGALVVDDSLVEIVKNGRIFRQALKEFSRTEREVRNPEKLRSATTNLVRAVESFKRHYSRLYPESNVRNHPLVGCLYGYAQPRTATLDKAALVAQETMLDIWSLNDIDLRMLVHTTETDYKTMSRYIIDIQTVVEEEVLFEEVA